ncbi:hypothetical protein NDU88_000511 [Pleurodeles waltl]|uniref:Uncharacterized protein n=1 Tax=Pleurodeles waltl TaxID=8319 RepID=A0AAV7S8T2_PLEWA|nr:hypothetical protein NDU88_000511 [Pleurodeles waltl]
MSRAGSGGVTRIMSRAGSGGITDSPAATLKWDYSGIRLSQSERAPQAPSDMALTLNLTESENCPKEQANDMASSDTKVLQLIYGTVRELQTDTGRESKSPSGHQTTAGFFVWRYTALILVLVKVEPESENQTVGL